MLFGFEWSELKKFEKLSDEERSIVFYAENLASKNHLGPLIDYLTSNLGLKVCYISSVKNDPFFLKESTFIKTFYIGDGAARTKFFLTLKAKILIMDMPDLESFHIKKSKIYPVHYVYVFHSIFSSHSYLRKDALIHYDTIFCVGEHHIDEIKTAEKKYNLPSKNLVQYGFPRLDNLLKLNTSKNNYDNNNSIIIAPSYGENNLLEICGEDLIELLLNNKYKVILRPHFRILKDNKILIKNLINKFSNHKNFHFIDGIINTNIFNDSVTLISDWSGISFEYAFAFKKPVIFIDVPKKIINSHFSDLEILPIEFTHREKLGIVISPEKINCIPNLIDEIRNDTNLEKSILETRSKTIFNLGTSSKVGSFYLSNLLNELKSK